MQRWQKLLESFSGINSWITEPMLLPWQPGEWCVVIESDVAVVRTGFFEGFSIERELAVPMLAAANNKPELPEAIIVYGQDQEKDTALFSEELRARIQWRRGDLGSALLLNQSPLQTPNLLQGNFAVRLPLARWWRQWRAAAAVLALAFCVQLAATYTEFVSLERENTELRLAVEQSYRKAYPRGAMVDAEKQLSRQLGALRGSSQASGFVSLINRVGDVISRSPGTGIASINYNDKGDEIRMNITARNFEAVDDIRTAMNSAGLSATMESSNAQGDQVRARMRVGAGS
jgi:type II secretion system protein L